MRVALVHAFSWPEVRRGAERLVAEMARGLAATGHDVTVVSSAFEPGRTMEDGVFWLRLRRRHRDVAKAEADFGRRVLVPLVSGHFDVVHTHGRRDGVASIRAALARPGRATVHTDIGIPDRTWWSTQGREHRWAERVIRDVDAYCCMSRYSLERLARDYGRTGDLLPGGVDIERFRPEATRTAAPTILYSGTLTESRKGVASLIAALPEVLGSEPDARLQLSGPGDAAPLLAEAPAAVRDHIDVLGVGTLDDQPGRYGRAWVSALPSHNDTFGLVLIEALACGTPIVAADNAALPELVTPGLTGALCTFGDVPSVARACLEAIALARDPGTASRCRTSALGYDWATGVVPRCIEVYAAALERAALRSQVTGPRRHRLSADD